MLKRYKNGISIGFTGIASLKSKGMLPRSSGEYIIGQKYSCTGKPMKTKKYNRLKRGVKTQKRSKSIKDYFGKK
jgi:hypothetical protein